MMASLATLLLLPTDQCRGQYAPLIPVKTLGGPVYWSDVVVRHDWRIQQHVETGRCRLLDDRDRLLITGSIHDCYRELECRTKRGEIAPLPCRIVLVMHGLAGSRRLMSGMVDYLRAEGGLCVLNMGYASTKGTIQQQTLWLESVLRNLPGVQEVDLVCHSQGNILVRHLLYRMRRQSNPPPIQFRRMVMISPPNHGSYLADTVGQRCFFQWALGEVVDQYALFKGWSCLESQLEIPGFDFGIIAGGKCDGEGYWMLLPGDDDSVVPLSSQYLAGYADFIQVGGLHQILPRFKRTQRATLHFLLCGHFPR
jgi:hypothetical protein